MNKIILSIFFSSFLVFLTASNVFACTCRLPDSPELIDYEVREAYKKSSLIFVGEVVDAVEDTNVLSVAVKFKAEKTWGRKFQKEVTLTTSSGGALCGYTFEVGKKYLVYAFGDKYFTTNICTRTALAEANKDVAVLNKIKKPKLKSSPK